MKTNWIFWSFMFLFIIKANATYAQNGELPNIIFILADDLGYGDIQTLNPASSIPTPNINLLANEGLSFSNAHSTSSVCTPSRYSFLTGQYSWRSRMKKGVCWIYDPPLIEKEQITIGEMLSNQGYKTACIGKWHLGWNWPTNDGLPAAKNNGMNVNYSEPIDDGPISRGFDYYFGQDTPSLPPHVLIENDQVVTPPIDWLSGPGGMPGHMSPGWKYENLMHTLSEKAVNYIRDQVKNDPMTPFFLYYSMSAPHTPIAPHHDFKNKTEIGPYGDFVFEMDYHVGRIINTVDSLGIGDKTIIIFTSDNGGINEDGINYTGVVGSLINHGHNSNGMLRGIKSDAWEGGHRIPFIVRWPNQIRSNTTSHALISQVDMMATFAAISGTTLPEEAGEDSFNLLPIFNDPSHQGVRDALVTQSGNGVLAIQKGDWKLILSSGGGGSWSHPKGELPTKVEKKGNFEWENIQLYNLKNDKAEIQNLASNQKDKVDELMRLLKNYIVTGRSKAPLHKSGEENIELWEEVKWVDQISEN